MALRVAQIDARILDAEVEELVCDAVDKLISTLPVAFAIIGERLRPEIRLVVRGILWMQRLLKGRSIGQEFMNLHYANYDRRRVVLHFVIEALLPYAALRLSDAIPNRNHRLRQLASKFETWSSVVSLLDQFYFLRNGGFSTLVERIVGLRSKYSSPPTLGVISFDALNRELLWHSFRDVIVLALPLIRMGGLLWRRRLAPAGSALLPEDELKCARCSQSPVIPTHRNPSVPNDGGLFCQHIFCYYCYTSEVQCERCGKPLDERSMRFFTGKTIRR